MEGPRPQAHTPNHGISWIYQSVSVNLYIHGWTDEIHILLKKNRILF